MCGKNLIIASVSLVILMFSCKQTGNEIISNEFKITQETSENAKKNSGFNINLPVAIDSSAYIVFSINKNKIEKSDEKISYRKSYDYFVDNLIFQHKETGETQILTKKKVTLKSYEQLYTKARIPEKIMVYEVIDTFPKNEDEQIYSSLYLGTNDGKTFKKITQSNEGLTHWIYLPETKKIYFKTVSHANKNNSKDDNIYEDKIYSVSIENYSVKQLLTKELDQLK